MLSPPSRRGREEAHTLVILEHIPEMVSACIMGFSHAHRVVREIHIAVIAWIG